MPFTSLDCYLCPSLVINKLSEGRSVWNLLVYVSNLFIYSTTVHFISRYSFLFILKYISRHIYSSPSSSCISLETSQRMKDSPNPPEELVSHFQVFSLAWNAVFVYFCRREARHQAKVDWDHLNSQFANETSRRGISLLLIHLTERKFRI